MGCYNFKVDACNTFSGEDNLGIADVYENSRGKTIEKLDF